jgi:hypothetical protein
MQKLIRDGKVAVLYSPNYGAGWSTWGLPVEALFHPELAEAVMACDLDKMHAIAKREWPTAYLSGLDNLQVEWVPEGAQFRIDEYDGFESVVCLGRETYHTA